MKSILPAIITLLLFFTFIIVQFAQESKTNSKTPKKSKIELYLEKGNYFSNSMINADSAFWYFDKAMALSEKTSDTYNFLQAKQGIAHTYSNVKGEYETAEKLLQEILETGELIQNDSLKHRIIISSMLNLGVTFGERGLYETEINWYNKALKKQLAFFGENDGYLGDIYSEIFIHYQYQDDNENAVKYINKAKEVRQREYDKNPSKDNAFQLARAYNNLGVSIGYLELNRQQLFYYKQAEKYYQEYTADEISDLGILFLGIADAYKNIGDFELSEYYYKNSRRIIHKNLGTSHYYYALSSGKLCNLYEAYNYKDSLQKYSQNLLAIVESNKSVPPNFLVPIYVQVSRSFWEADDFQKALDVINYSIENQQQYGNNLELMQLLTKAHILNDLKNHQETDELLDTVLNKITTQPKNYRYNSFVKFYQTKQGIFSKRGRWYEAAKANHKIFELLLKTKIDTAITSVPSINLLVQQSNALHILKSKIAILKRLHETTKQQQYFDAVINGIDTLLVFTNHAYDSYKTNETKMFLSKEAAPFFKEIAIYIGEIATKQKNDELLKKSFVLSEYSRSAMLQDKLLSYKTIETDSVWVQFNILEEKRFQLEKQIEIVENQSKKATLKKELGEVMSNINTIKSTKQIPTEIERKPFDLAAYQQSLSDDNLVISYILHEDKYGQYTITKDNIIFEIINAKKVNDTVNDFQTALLNQNTKPIDFQTIGHKLYQSLLAKALKGKSIKNLTIIQDDLLYQLPFEILIKQKNEQPTFTNLAYIMKDYIINYEHSATVQQQRSDVKRKDGKGFLAISPDYDQKQLTISDTLENKLLARTVRDGYFSLKGAAKEVENITTIWNGDKLTGNTATKANFLKKATDYKILHLAMHALVNNDKPEYSKLIFAKKNSSNYAYLYNYELFSKQLKADLVVLSACNTGTGKIQNGEGIISLAKGFAYTGVPTIVQSLWQVPDQATSELMTNFYQELKNGENKAEALQQAKLKYLENQNGITTHPLFWAGFTITGDVQPIQTNSWNVYYWIIGIIVLLGIGVWFFRRKFFV